MVNIDLFKSRNMVSFKLLIVYYFDTNNRAITGVKTFNYPLSINRNFNLLQSNPEILKVLIFIFFNSVLFYNKKVILISQDRS